MQCLFYSVFCALLWLWSDQNCANDTIKALVDHQRGQQPAGLFVASDEHFDQICFSEIQFVFQCVLSVTWLTIQWAWSFLLLYINRK